MHDGRAGSSQAVNNARASHLFFFTGDEYAAEAPAGVCAVTGDYSSFGEEA